MQTSQAHLPSPDVTADLKPGEIALEVEGSRVRFDFGTIADNVGDVQAWLWWSDLLSRAERELLILEAGVAQSRASAVSDLLRHDPKTAEWKARALVDETKQMFAARSAIAEATRNVTLLREVVQALRPSSRA